MAFTPQYSPPPPGRPGHELLIAGASILIIIFLAFAGLVGYYIWQIKTGAASTLVTQFSDEFSADPSITSRSIIPTLDIPAATLERDYSPTLGEPNAPIRLTMFIDFECPFCVRSYPIVREIIDRYGSAIRVVFKHMPIYAIHPDAERAHLAAACAHEQNAFWPYYDLLFSTQDLSEDGLSRHAKTLGLDINIFASCLEHARHQDNVKQDLTDGVRAGVRGTPTYFINQTRLQGVLPIEVWESIILDTLRSI